MCIRDSVKRPRICLPSPSVYCDEATGRKKSSRTASSCLLYTSTNRYGGTALIPACERGLVETVRMLLAAGVDPNHVNRLGWTGLLEAIILSDGGPDHQAVVALLIAGGADVNLADGDGRSLSLIHI